MDLNFKSLAIAFLWRDQPIVIRTIAKIFSNGCSNAVSRNAESSMEPSESNPFGETKYNMNPITN